MAETIREIMCDGTSQAVTRDWVPEHPVALEFNGLSYAVMMATPEYLDDFATGFALTEGLARTASDVTSVSLAETDIGWIARTTVAGLGVEKLQERVRTRVAESSCGLCGIENLEALARPLPVVAGHTAVAPQAVFHALSQLRDRQPLGRQTGAAHAAAFASLDGDLSLVREDVGRHNAIDKLVGALAREGTDIAQGFVVSTARCSFEIVEKLVRAGATRLVTISLPTSMAVEKARSAGLSLACLARDDSFLVVNEPQPGD